MKRKNPNKLIRAIEELQWDIWLAAVTIGLVIFGVVMVYSASAGSKNAIKSLWAQILWAACGVLVMAVVRRIDYHRYCNPTFIFGFLGFCTVLLVTVFLFPAINGAHRWLLVGGFSFQPSELTKIALTIFLAWFLAGRERAKELDDFWATIAPAVVVIGILALLIVKEPDLGTTMILGVIFLLAMYIVGVPARHVLKLSPILLIGGLWLTLKVSWRFERIKTFFDPEADPLGKGYQILQSMIAVGSGGIHGLGFGHSKQKLSFIIAPQSDFIFAVIAEELGLIGASTLIFIYGLFLWRGLRAGRRAPDREGELIAVCLTVGIVVQALFNISVTLNLLPAKGITLPFISAGGSSLLICLAMVGILLNISEQGKDIKVKS